MKAQNKKIRMPTSYHVMCKPIGPRCNLDCKYCFYTEKEALFGEGEKYPMDHKVLEEYVRKYIKSQRSAPEINFAWQGGEPTLMGLDFFRKAVALQKRYGRGRKISNSFQTNGILLDDKWCEFLAKEDFLVGLSIDGPPEIHDKYRVDRGGNPTFDKVHDAMKRMQDWHINYNTLSSVTRDSGQDPTGVYGFLKSTGTEFMQFIPIVERKLDQKTSDLGLKLAEPPDLRDKDESTDVTPWSVEPLQYGIFLSAVFDDWVRSDVGKVFVQMFDVALGAWMGQNPSLCNFSRTCGFAVAMEHNGDVYACDHFVYPDYYVGNIVKDQVEDIMTNPRLAKFGADKWNALPQYCRECDYLFTCHGGCPKNRFRKSPSGEPGLNYLCRGYKRFFKHVDPHMKRMAHLLRQGKPATEIMNYNSKKQR